MNGGAMEINKAGRPTVTSEKQDSSKTESFTNSKTRTSKGIAESESKFETLKPNSLFQDAVCSSNRNPRSAGGTSNTTSSITDGTSNTIQVGEQSSGEQPTNQVPPITDGTSNTIQTGEQSADSTRGTPLEGRPNNGTNTGNQQSSVPTITDGTSNTIQVGAQSSESSEDPVLHNEGSPVTVGNHPPAADQQPVTNRTSPLTGTSNTTTFEENTEQSNSESSNNSSTGNVTDGTSNTIFIGEETEQSGSENTNNSSTGNVTDGTSNTILIGETSEEESRPAGNRNF
jgi:hypothetical protein